MNNRFDFYQLTMPSGHHMTLKVETPLTAKDRAWLHALVDLILGDDTPSQLIDKMLGE